MRGFIAAILGMGILRFILTVAGVANSTVRWFSMTAVIAAGAVFFAIATKTHKDRLFASYFLIIPYMTIEVLALGYTWLSGQETIFHAPEYSLRLGITAHLAAHLLGGLSLEPLTLFIVMEIVWVIYTILARFLSRD